MHISLNVPTNYNQMTVNNVQFCQHVVIEFLMKESGSAADIVIHSYCVSADVCMGATFQSKKYDCRCAHSLQVY